MLGKKEYCQSKYLNIFPGVREREMDVVVKRVLKNFQDPPGLSMHSVLAFFYTKIFGKTMVIKTTIGKKSSFYKKNGQINVVFLSKSQFCTAYILCISIHGLNQVYLWT